jgi:hypothetical protein
MFDLVGEAEKVWTGWAGERGEREGRTGAK